MSDAAAAAALSCLRRCCRDDRVRHGHRSRASARACWRSMPRSMRRRCRASIETVPTYRSLMVQFDPLDLRLRTLPAAGARAGRHARSRAEVRAALEGAGRLRRQVRHRPRRDGRAAWTDARAAHRQAHGARLPRLYDRVHAGLHLSGRPRSLDRHLAPHRSAADDARRLHFHRRHPGADRRPGHAVGLAHPGVDAGAHLHGRSRAGVSDGARRRGRVRAGRRRAAGMRWIARQRQASRWRS